MARNLDNLMTKENWQNFQHQPGPSHTLSQLFHNKVAGKSTKQTWTCSVCKKELSSKRSYTEHMNIHNKTRPFRCEHCAYAAASQMTLHRHKLRNHTPKTEWGYRCPYCDEAYMEPAGYQQHVQQRHPGKSATYGCPFRICNLRSKSQRHFRDHLAKHDRNDKIENGEDPCELNNYELVRYIINDEIGMGYGVTSWSPPPATPPTSTGNALPVQKVIIRARPTVKIAAKMTTTSSGAVVPNPTTRIVRIATDRKLVWNEKKAHVSSLHLHQQPHHHNVQAPPPQAPPTSVRYYVQSAQPSQFHVASYHHHQNHQNHQNHYEDVEVEEDEEEYVENDGIHENHYGGGEEEEEEYDDDGPPILNPETILNSEDVVEEEEYIEEEHWEQHEEIVNTEVRVFSNGFIDDDELD